MGIRETPSGGLWVTGTTPAYQVPARFPNTISDKFTIAPSRATWGFGTSKAMRNSVVPIAIEGSVYIDNPDMLKQIAEGAGLTTQFLARDAAKAALELYETAEQLLADEVKGKLHIEVTPYGGKGDYLVSAQVNKEPAVRRTASNATIRVDKAGHVLRDKRYVHAKEAPSITTYVAMKMHIAFQAARVKVQEHSTMAVQGQIISAFGEFGVKVDARGVSHAPAGGIEFGGKFYGGGQVLPKV